MRLSSQNTGPGNKLRKKFIRREGIFPRPPSKLVEPGTSDSDLMDMSLCPTPPSEESHVDRSFHPSLVLCQWLSGIKMGSTCKT